MDPMQDTSERGTAEALIREMARLQAGACPDCSGPLCAHQVLMNLALGFKESPRCLKCLATAMEQPAGPFRNYLIDYLQQRECHQTAWAWANRDEGLEANSVAPCRAIGNVESAAKTL